MQRFWISAGNNSTDLGTVGRANTLLGAKRIGRAAVKTMLPNGEGVYTVRDRSHREVAGEERSIRTQFRWSQRVV